MAATKKICLALGAAALQACSAFTPAYDFSAEIADCKAREDIKFILQGKFGEVREKFAKFENVREEVDGMKKPKLISHFKVDRLVFGSADITDNRTGKQLAPSLMEIRDGDVAPEALGKKAIICFGGKPSKIKAVHLAK